MIDNLDKSWATRGSTPEDILILRGLLDAVSKLREEYEDRGIDLKPIVFIRPDIHENLVKNSPDRGKEGAVQIEWEDAEAFKELVLSRIQTSTDLNGSFEEAWVQIFPPAVRTEESFGYLLERTLGRPRDLLDFIQAAVDVATNRGHVRVTEDDIEHAENAHSNDVFQALVLEIEDTHPVLAMALYGFHGIPRHMSYEEVAGKLRENDVRDSAVASSIELLVWFGFLGVMMKSDGTERYAYDPRYTTDQLLHLEKADSARFVVHPAFRTALHVP